MNKKSSNTPSPSSAPAPSPAPASSPAPAPKLDPLALMRNLARAGQAFHRAACLIAQRHSKDAAQGLPQDPLNAIQAQTDFFRAWLSNPAHAFQSTARFWSEQIAILSRPALAAFGMDDHLPNLGAPSDRRFANPAWNDNPFFRSLRESHLAASAWLAEQAATAPGLNSRSRQRAVFHLRQITDMLSPANIALTNPDALEAIQRDNGEGLAQGMENLAEDLALADGALTISHAPDNAFVVGKNVATTPGKVVFRNDVLEIIHYTPTTETTHQRPLLIFPPWINKFYVLDINKQKSFVRWALDQGIPVFMTSWINPGANLANATYEDYLQRGILAASDAVRLATGEKQINVIGYCIGGTLLACALAWLKAKGDTRFASATFFAAQADFSEPGDLGLFIDDEQLANLETIIDAHNGLLPSSGMANAFNMLRANDLIWFYVVNNYMLGKKPPAVDMLAWNADATRMPGSMHLFYLRTFYRDNALAKGTMTLAGETLDLSKVNLPLYIQAGEDDHIAPALSVYKNLRLFGGKDKRFVLAGSGHIVGVINPPAAKKYYHRLNPDGAQDNYDTWLAGATTHKGSWWPDWGKWIKRRSGPKIAARIPGEGGLPALEDAPGSYVIAD